MALVKGKGPWCGTAGGYNNHDCRCAECTEAWRDYHREYIHNHPEQKSKHAARQRDKAS